MIISICEPNETPIIIYEFRNIDMQEAEEIIRINNILKGCRLHENSKLKLKPILIEHQD